MSPDVTLNRSEKKVSGRARARSVIQSIGLQGRRSANPNVRSPTPQALDSMLPMDQFYPAGKAAGAVED